MRFPLRPALLSTLFLMTAALPALSEAPTPASDLATITQKAGDDPRLQNWLQQMVQLKSRPEDGRMLMYQQIFQSDGVQRGLTDEPFRYRVKDLLRKSQMRAQNLSQILISDLDNDGRISKQEVKDTLSVMPTQGAAEAFFSSDANDDDILSPDEIRAAVDRQLNLSTGSYGRPSSARLFDFDDDGVLTAEELQRGMQALGFPAK